MSETHARGYVIQREERGESDVLATLLLDDGRLVRAIAKNAARSTRRFSAGLAPFTLYRFVFGRATPATQRLEEASPESVHPAILADLRRLGAASTASVLVRELGGDLAGDTGLFHLYAALLASLERADPAQSGAAMLRFMFEVFDHAGHPIVLDACTRCGRECPDNALVQLHPSTGGVVCSSCGGGPLTLRAAERRAAMALREGELSGFAPTMLHWVARLMAGHAPKSSEALERATGYWAQ